MKRLSKTIAGGLVAMLLAGCGSSFMPSTVQQRDSAEAAYHPVSISPHPTSVTTDPTPTPTPTPKKGTDSVTPHPTVMNGDGPSPSPTPQ